MISIRKSEERGHNDWGWLKTYYTFSFANYYDPDYMGYSKLRVLNEDRVEGGRGFDAHPHKDMEIITYVLEGALVHKDSMGNSSIISAGDLQKMTAGKGVLHSEYNASDTDLLHFLQIWILPNETGLKPGYEQVSIDKENIEGGITLVASGNTGRNQNIITLNQDTDLYLGIINNGENISKQFAKERKIWLQLISGKILLSGNHLEAGDGASIENEGEINITAGEKSEFLIFNMN